MNLLKTLLSKFKKEKQVENSLNLDFVQDAVWDDNEQ